MSRSNSFASCLRPALYGLLCLAVIGFGSFGTAADNDVRRGSKEEVIILVKKAVAYYKANGADKAFAAFDNPKGPFTDHDLYIFVTDDGGTTLAHGTNPKLIGKNRIDEQDIDGKYFVRKHSELMKTHSSFWQTLKFPDPITHRIRTKQSYCEVVRDEAQKDIAVCSGVYDDAG